MMETLCLALIIILPIAWFTFGMGLLDEAIRCWPKPKRDPFPHVTVTEITVTEALGSEDHYA